MILIPRLLRNQPVFKQLLDITLEIVGNENRLIHLHTDDPLQNLTVQNHGLSIATVQNILLSLI